MGRLPDVRSGAIYSVLVIAMSTAVGLFVAAPSDFLIMGTPTLAALIMMLLVVRDGYSSAAWARLGINRAGLRYWAPALILPALIGVFALLVTLLIGQASLGLSPEAQGPDLLGSILVGGLLGLVLSALEEFGWRGYLLPRLMPLGQTRALWISGLVWATWHLPFILWFGYHSEGNLLLVLPLFYGTIVAAAFLFGYLRIYSDSVWPAVLGHWMHNFAWGVLALFTLSADPILVQEYLGGDNGIFILVGTILALLWAKRHYGWGKDNPPQV